MIDNLPYNQREIINHFLVFMRFRSKILFAVLLLLVLSFAVMLLTGCTEPLAAPMSIHDAPFPNSATQIFTAPGKDFDAAEKNIRRFLEDEKYQNIQQEQRVLTADLPEQDFLTFYNDKMRVLDFQSAANFNLASENATLRAWSKSEPTRRQIMIAALIKPQPRAEPQKPMILIFVAQQR